MKILMVSIFAPHFFNWTEQLRDSGHEVYWLDVFDSDTNVNQISFVHQITGWRYRWDYPGRYFIKKNLKPLNKFINSLNERSLEKTFEAKLENIKPDVVHSFVMYLGTAPILKVMRKYPKIKWIYSSWGSDLYYYRNIPVYKKAMEQTFPQLDYMFSDCERDFQIAKENGFKGNFLGVYPGGGGFSFKDLDPYIKPAEEKNIILIKGYQGKHGRCLEVLKALQKFQIKEHKIVVFGASLEVYEYCEKSGLTQKPYFKVYGKISQTKVLQLMGESLIYIGNSASDGMPNTLLEAIVMGAFPVQSNPGGATSEIIVDRKNGLLIQNPDNITEIETILQSLLNGEIDIKKGVFYNNEYIRPHLEREKIKKEVLEKYKMIENNLN